MSCGWVSPEVLVHNESCTGFCISVTVSDLIVDGWKPVLGTHIILSVADRPS